MNGYELTRDWFDFRFENPDKCRPIHTELYIYLVDQWNRLGQVKMFGLPTQYTMQVLNINSYNTFKSALESLIEFGFVKVVSESKNQHQSRVIALSNNDKATTKALDKANAKALYKALYEAPDTIIEQKNNTEQKKERTKAKSFVPPTLFEVVEYFKENHFTEQLAERAFKYYDVADWRDSKGNQVKNWKQKMQSVWFKDEYKVQQPNQQNKWTDPSQIDLKDDDWINKVPTPPEKGSKEYYEYLDYWRIRDLRGAQVDRRGYYDQI